MLKFILRRCLEAIPTLFILITISFFMMRLAPGSPFTGERTLPPEVMANIEAKYHLNDPINWRMAISVHRLNIKIIRSTTWLHPVFPFLPNWEPQHFSLR